MKRIVPFAVSLLILGCADPEVPVPGAFETRGEVEVTVNDIAITSDMLTAIIGHMPKARQEALLNNKEQKSRFLEQMVTSNLLYQEAIKNDLHKDDKAVRALAMANREILANLYLASVGDQAITDEAIQAKYDENKVRFGKPMTHLHLFTVRQQDLAENLVTEIKAGSDFANIAKANDPRAKANGGDMGWIPRSPLPHLEEAIKAAAVGDVVGPIQSPMGFHILKVEGRKDNTPIEEVRDELEQMVKVDAMKAKQADVKTTATIVYPASSDSSAETPSDAGGGDHAGHDHAIGEGH